MDRLRVGGGGAPPPGANEARVAGWGRLALRIASLALHLFGFLVAIETMSKAISGLADPGALGGQSELFAGVSNPFAGLAIGVLFTVMVQSSSTTTATIVAVVGSGALSVQQAVPMIMGANIGTTITNTLVSIGHVRRSADFRRAFAAATVHDFFNLMVVAIFLPLELATGFLSKSAAFLAERLPVGGGKVGSPVKQAIKSAHALLVDGLEAGGLSGAALGWVSLFAGLALTFWCLLRITRAMRRLLAGRIEEAMNRALGGTGMLAILIGVAITVAVQSSSITTSLLVPMCAAGVMSLESAFPVMLGANIGTTVTALLASLAQDERSALTIALVHVLFNVLGVALVWPLRPLRNVPLGLARRLALAATANRLWAVVYVLGTFVILPLGGWLLWRAVQ